MIIIDRYSKDLIRFGKKRAMGRLVRNILQFIKEKLMGKDERVDCLYYFLNNYVDIMKVPPAKGRLRALQEADVQFLRLFHDVCEKNNIHYWIDGGTLLGGVRHGGFIPWDDDIDVAVPRDEYEKAIKVLRHELGKYDIDVSEDRPMARCGIGYKHTSTGIWIDVFPFDTVYGDNDICIARKNLSSRYFRYRDYYLKRSKKAFDKKSMEIEKEKILKTDRGDGNIEYIIHAPEFDDRFLIHYKSDIMPRKKIKFESLELWGPNNEESYLKELYGSNYMQFPKSGVEHHGEDLKLADWASRDGVDMKDVCLKLRAYCENYESNLGDNL